MPAMDRKHPVRRASFQDFGQEIVGIQYPNYGDSLPIFGIAKKFIYCPHNSVPITHCPHNSGIKCVNKLFRSAFGGVLQEELDIFIGFQVLSDVKIEFGDS